MATRTLETVLGRAVSDTSERKQLGGKIPGLETKFRKLDLVLNGLRPDSMLVVGARTGMGKTAFGLCLARNLAEQDHLGVYYSLEMEATLLVYRLLAQETGINIQRLESGQITDDELKRVIAAKDKLAVLPLMLCDDVLNTTQLAEHARVIAAASKRGYLDYLVIDYATLLTDDAHLDQYNRVTKISQRVRNLARELSLPIILLVQLNREADKRDDKRPSLTDIRDSGAIEQDAFSILLLFRPAYYMTGDAVPAEERDAEVIVAKNRQGPVGKLSAIFRPERMEWDMPEPKPTPPKPVAAK